MILHSLKQAALAQRMLHKHPHNPMAAIKYGFELVTARAPSASEMRIITAEYEKQLVSFKDDLAAAKALLTVGESPRDASLDAASHAAWTNVAIVMLNLDEAITKD